MFNKFKNDWAWYGNKTINWIVNNFKLVLGIQNLFFLIFNIVLKNNEIIFVLENKVFNLKTNIHI